jgi:hypothetical protein
MALISEFQTMALAFQATSSTRNLGCGMRSVSVSRVVILCGSMDHLNVEFGQTLKYSEPLSSAIYSLQKELKQTMVISEKRLAISNAQKASETLRRVNSCNLVYVATSHETVDG